MRGHRRPRFGLFALLGVAAVVAGGCQYLLGFDPNDPTFTEPKPLATYRAGRATVTIGSDPAIVFTELTRPGTLLELYGADASFRNADGWYLEIGGASRPSGFMGESAYLRLDRIVDGQHWTTLDPSRCVVTIEAADEKALRGKASCKGLRWSDALGGFASFEPDYIEGQDPFDAEITFEAAPTAIQVS